MEDNDIFLKLKSILKRYEPQLALVHDKSDNYYLNTQISEHNKKAEFFGAVQSKKSYIAFHLMPVYYYPELLENLSPELKNQMQGKSCFNFKKTDEKLFDELNTLTKNCFEKYQFLKKI